MEALQEQEAKHAAERLARAKELAAVKVSKEDVASVAEELDLSAADAERLLRESGGDPTATLRLYASGK